MLSDLFLINDEDYEFAESLAHAGEVSVIGTEGLEDER